MAGSRQPVDLLLAKGKKHLTKAEIAERRASEVAPVTDEIKAPVYLPAVQRKRFDVLAAQLQKIKIMGETDVDALARYVAAQTLYETATRRLRVEMIKPDSDPYKLEQLSRLQDRYFKQANACARELGLTISSRCKLAVPQQEEPKVNRFAKFALLEGGEK